MLTTGLHWTPGHAPALRQRGGPVSAQRRRSSDGSGPLMRTLKANSRHSKPGGRRSGSGGRKNGDARSSKSAKGRQPSRGFGGRPGLDDPNSDEADEDVWSSSDEALELSAVLGELTDSEVAELVGEDTSGPDALAGADALVEADLAAVMAQFPFALDGFQVSAVRRVLSGRSVVVCAPTGAGKTAIAEAAAIHFLQRGGRVL